MRIIGKLTPTVYDAPHYRFEGEIVTSEPLVTTPPANITIMPPKASGLTSCPKCGRAGLIIRYHKGSLGTGEHFCSLTDYDTSPTPHLHTYCQTCLYDWTTPDATP